jgi:hypothetical protein
LKKKPDEGFIIFSNNQYYIKILEKKNQNVEGSVIDKLKTGQFNKREYEKIINNQTDKKFNISYAFCISNYLKNKLESNQIMKDIIKEDDINVFYGEDEKYFDTIFEWINMI